VARYAAPRTPGSIDLGGGNFGPEAISSGFAGGVVAGHAASTQHATIPTERIVQGWHIRSGAVDRAG
jgi:hypothetical protein